MTPAQLRAFTSVVRFGSVKSAAAELGVSESAISLHVAHLRRELGDKLFTPTAAGLAFTPGGLRLASRAAQILGLQHRTMVEVAEASSGRRLLRIAASSLFAEYAAPGLIELFAGRANDLDVELSLHNPRHFNALLMDRTVDVAIGPRPAQSDTSIACTPFLHYQIIAVTGPDNPLARMRPGRGLLQEQTWLLGPSATVEGGVVAQILQRLEIPEDRQRIFQSHAAAIEVAKRGSGVALAVSFPLTQDLAKGDLVRIQATGLQSEGSWAVLTLTDRAPSSPAAELSRFVTTPRATQAMLRGAGVTAGRFRPSIHVTLWS